MNQNIKKLQKLICKCRVGYGTVDEVIEFCDFKNSHLPYYLIVSGERHGCFEQDTGFVGRQKVNEIIKSQLEGDVGKDNKYDDVVIIDMKTIKRVYPKL